MKKSAFLIIVWLISLTSCNNDNSVSKKGIIEKKYNNTSKPILKHKKSREKSRSTHNKNSLLNASNTITIEGNGRTDYYRKPEQVWMKKNLNLLSFNNGDPIPIINNENEWFKAGKNKEPACCFYNNNPENKERYGVLYNWYAVTDKRGLAPKGWHIATLEEWERIIKTKWDSYVEEVGVEVYKPNIPRDFYQYGGSRVNNKMENGYGDVCAKWWTYTHLKGETAHYIGKCLKNNLCDKKFSDKSDGYYVRCVKDYPVKKPSGLWLSKDYVATKIYNQVWMGNNLRTLCFQNGDSILFVENETQFNSACRNRIPACCFSDFNPKNGERDGLLYNYFAVFDARGLAPNGWEIPSKADWLELANSFGGINKAGDELKSKTGWVEHCNRNGNGNNKSNFNAYPSGIILSPGKNYNGSGVGQYATFWSSSGTINYKEQASVYAVRLSHQDDNLYQTSGSEFGAYSVRCLKKNLNGSEIIEEVEEPLIEDVEIRVTPPKPTPIEIEDNKVYVNDELDEVASFPGGKALLNRFLSNNTNFPDICNDMNASGRVIASFIVEKDGSITNVTIVKNRTGCNDFSKEAKRVIYKMPKWEPAVISGKKVRMKNYLPFNFYFSN